MCASVTAFGATKSDVNKVVNTSVAYAFDGKYSQGGYTIANAKNFYILTKSGADVSAYKEAFFASAKMPHMQARLPMSARSAKSSQLQTSLA